MISLNGMGKTIGGDSMAEVKWIKIVVDIFDDEKMLLIESLPDADSIIVCWFKLLCLAGKQNNDGVLMLNDRLAYTDEMLATVFRRPLQTVRLALETFEQFGMVEIMNGAITIPNWGKHQSLDRLDKLREYQRDYHREYRKKQEKIPESTESKDDRKLYVNTLEEEIEEDKKENKKKNISSFIPPTLEEVQAYCAERKNNVDAKKFFDYYATSNWHDKSGEPIHNWKQKMIAVWEEKEEQKPQKRSQITTAKEYKPPNSTIDVSLLNKIKGVGL